jgi:lysozyme
MSLVLPASIIAEAKIEEFEGFGAHAYEDPLAPGVWTIGFGTTDGVKKGDVMTREQAEARVRSDLRSLFTQLNRAVLTQLTQNQSDALYSLVYNVGIGKFIRSRLCVKLNKADRSAPNEFLDWCHDRNGNVVPGLQKRRNWEYARFLTNPWPPRPLVS